MTQDIHQRQFKTLRVSLTTACNLACTYCVPEGEQLKCESNEISAIETVKIVQMLVKHLGINKIRLTGGEPLISNKLTELLPLIRPLKIVDLSLTTNGQTLAQKAFFLKENGIERINVSLDTLDPDNFERITRGGKLQKTLDGIKKAQSVGLKIKINMIPMRGVNEKEIVTMLDYCLDNDIELRYIELMRMGHLANLDLFQKKVIPLSVLLAEITEKYQFSRGNNSVGSTATRFEIEGRGHFGVIANDSEPFCGTCDRLRLTSDGKLLGCISSNHSFSVKNLLQELESDRKTKLDFIIKSALATKREISFDGSGALMKTLGG
ncbi:MAG: GTP 3',8-cyclase MoaA [Proteobacteria bacterium]|nr:GTP 3',8-cyclase MoaA [Pseudomonadota bacterium]